MTDATDDDRCEWHPIGVQFVYGHAGQFLSVVVDALYYPSSSDEPMLRYRLRQGDSLDEVSFDAIGESLPGDPVDLVEYVAWAEQHADELDDIATEGVWMFAVDHLKRCEASLRTLAGNCSDVATVDKVLGVAAQLQAIRTGARERDLPLLDKPAPEEAKDGVSAQVRSRVEAGEMTVLEAWLVLPTTLANLLALDGNKGVWKRVRQGDRWLLDVFVDATKENTE